MFTRAELRKIPLLSKLSDDQLDYLTKNSADLRLRAHEYILHEGDMQRALFILVEGRLEVTKIVDGVESVIGSRNAGESFGEVAISLYSPYAVSFRVTEDSRIIRVEAKDFHAIAAAAPDLSAAVDSAALDRVEGLREIAAAPSHPMLTVIGPQFDEATHELREFLLRNMIEFDWNYPDTSAMQMPAVRLRDGKVLERPTIREVACSVGLCVSPPNEQYDVAILGGGPAGLAAAVYGASEGLATLLIECEAPGGQAGTSSRIENYLGFPYGVSGGDLAHRALEQAKRLGADIVVTRCVNGIDPATHTVLLDEGDTVRAKAMIIATGVTWRHLNIESVDSFAGRGVYYGAAPGEAKYVVGEHVFLVGGGNSAGQAAINISNFAQSVTLLVRGETLAKSMSHYLIEQLKDKSNVSVETRSEVVDAFGNACLEEIDVINHADGTTQRRTASALFTLIGADAETAWLPPEIARDADGYVLTGPAAMAHAGSSLSWHPFLLETTVPGIFAVGDVRAGSIKRVAAAVGEGSMSIAFVHQYLAGVRI